MARQWNVPEQWDLPNCVCEFVLDKATNDNGLAVAYGDLCFGRPRGKASALRVSVIATLSADRVVILGFTVMFTSPSGLIDGVTFNTMPISSR